MMTKRVALFTASGLDVINTPMINSAEYLASLGYAVDIFARSPYDGWKAPEFQNESVRYHITEILPGTFRSRFGKINLLINVLRIMRQNTYDFVIGFDPRAFQLAYVIAKIFRIPAVYHSLEFYKEITIKQQVYGAFQNFFVRHSDWMITQDAMRADWLSNKYRFPREKISVVYNSSLGDCMPNKSKYLRNKFDIPDEKIVVLAVGSLIKPHMISEITESVSRWNSEFVLVIHGWFSQPEYETRILGLAEQHPGRIFISTDFLPLNRKYEVFQSADIGLVTFTPDNDNNQFVGAAAGKLFEFTRCGVPVVVNELAGMREFVGRRCGEICGPWLDSIETALETVQNNYATYSNNCTQFYEKYSFSTTYHDFLKMFCLKGG
jgi:glycosyltransferase involved in cell wall biosynthesis